MPGGRPKKSLALAVISGADRKNPQRYRARKEAARAQPKLPALGAPPQDWTTGAAGMNGRCIALLEIWQQLVEQDLAGLRVLNVTHRILMRNACQLQYKIDQAMKGYGKATSGDWTTMKSYLGAMGMTPVDSSKVAESVRLPDRETGGSASRPGLGWGEYVG